VTRSYLGMTRLITVATLALVLRIALFATGASVNLSLILVGDNKLEEPTKNIRAGMAATLAGDQTRSKTYLAQLTAKVGAAVSQSWS
jgi:hypothetical protein